MRLTDKNPGKVMGLVLLLLLAWTAIPGGPARAAAGRITGSPDPCRGRRHCGAVFPRPGRAEKPMTGRRGRDCLKAHPPATVSGYPETTS
jgi:hypothetical protein